MQVSDRSYVRYEATFPQSIDSLEGFMAWFQRRLSKVAMDERVVDKIVVSSGVKEQIETSLKNHDQHHTAVMDMRKESMCGYPLSVNDAYVDQQPGDKYHDFFIFAWD